MKKILDEYVKTYTSLNKECKNFLLLYFLRSYSAGIVFYIAIYFSTLNLDANIIGYEISSLVLGNLLGSLFASQILTNKNVLKLAGFSLVIQGLCFLIISFNDSVYLLGAAVFFIGFSGYFYQVSNNFLITSISGTDKNSRSKAITLMSVFSNLGLSLGGVSVSLVSENHAQLLFLSTGILLIAISVPYFKNNTELGGIIDYNINNDEPPNLTFFSLSLLSILVAGMIFAQQRVGFGIFLNENFSGSGMSTIIVINSAIIIFILPLLRPFLIKVSSVITMGFGVLLLGGGMFLLQYVKNFYLVALLCIVWTFGEMISNTLSQLICFQCSKKEKRGKSIGIYKFLYSVGTFVGAFLAASMLKHYSLNSLWILCGLLGTIMFIIPIFVYNFKNKFNPLKYKHSL
jgi:MFS family permease